MASFGELSEEKLGRGGGNQDFLVASIAGVETLKGMGVEPHMKRRWEEQLAGYVAASFKVLRLGNTPSNSVQFVNKAVMAGILYFGAQLVLAGSLSVGELGAFNLLPRPPTQPCLPPPPHLQYFHHL